MSAGVCRDFRSRSRLFAWLVLVLCLVEGLAAAQGSSAAGFPRAYITLVGPGDASLRVKEVAAELLARRDRMAVTWSRQDAFRPQDIFVAGGQVGTDGMDGVSAWIDLSAEEARLYFRDSRADRFFLRALSLAQGIDEIAIEEIAHIVSNAVVALGHGSGEALTRSEARKALHMQSAPETPPKVVALPSPPLCLEVSAMAGAQVLARELPLVAGAKLALALTRGPRWGRSGGAFGGWMDFGYQFAARFRGDAVGVDLQTTSLRAGVLWKIEGLRALALHIGLGAGADRTHYRPQGSSATVELAPSRSFYVPAASLWVGLDLRLIDALALTVRMSADAALATVHFDLHDSDGQTSRVIVPYAIRPAAAIGLSTFF